MSNIQRYAKCAASGCLDTPRQFSRYCGFHYRRLERTRDLRGRVLTKGELRGHRELAGEFLDRNAMHPAVVAAHEYFVELLTDDGRARFLSKEFTRLRDSGATPRAMLAAFLAVWSWENVQTSGRLADRCIDLNLGRAVLGVVPAKQRRSRKGKIRYVRISPGHAEALGASLRADLGLFALQAAKHIDRMVSASHFDTQRMKEALESTPFASPMPIKETGE